MSDEHNDKVFLELIEDMDAGVLWPVMESMARKIAIGVVSSEDPKAKGTLEMKFVFTRIEGTAQIRIHSKITEATPTLRGMTGEFIEGQTNVHVSLNDRGAMTILPEAQLTIKFDT